VLRPFVYHQKIAAHLKRHSALWKFFATDAVKAEDFKQFTTELLKNTYRLSPEAEPEVYAAVDKAKAVLNISHTITVYQLLESTDLNAFVYVLPDEGHIVLSGSILKLMNSTELEAVLAHELGHIKLFAEDGGDYQIADRILGALGSNASTPIEYLETARLYDLYTELYCDQMALKVTGDVLPVVSSLVKVNTGLERVSPESYLQQAAEIFEAGDVKSETITHPENFIRAYALHIFQTTPSEFEQRMAPIIQGHYKLRELDIFSREALHGFSKQLVAALLAVPGLQTEALVNLARQYFPDFEPSNAMMLVPESIPMAQFDESGKEYLSYILLDFALADKELGQEAYAHAYSIADSLGLREMLKDITKKELKLTEKKFNERYKKTLATYA
jgi:hypothetical protein